MAKAKNRDAGSEITRKADKYWVPIVSKTIDLLDCFRSEVEELTLEEVVQRTGIPHTTAYRILHTLALRDYLQQSGHQYKINRLRKRLKLGFANLSRKVSLAVEIQRSLEQAALKAGVDLLVWDNDRNAEAAIKNAAAMVECHIDIAIEFQLFEHVAPVIADIFSRAGIPMISVVNPHHGSLYFGVNNYRAGFSAGLALAEFAADRWGHQPDSILLLESPLAGRTVQSRMIGVLRGIEERLGSMPDNLVQHVDGGGEKSASKTAVQSFLGRRIKKRILIAGINDESAIGAVQALREAKGRNEFAVVGHGGSAEMLQLVSDPRSPAIGTVSFRAEAYGAGLMKFALPALQGTGATPAQYVPHEFLGKNSLANLSL